MRHWFVVAQLDVERLLAEWRWLCADRVRLVARNAFADLFFCGEAGRILQLDIAVGKLTNVADSEAQFLELAETREKREEWFAESDEEACASRGLKPGVNQCIGFSVPLVFAESGAPDTPYVVDIYDYVSFLGDLHRQISGLPDGANVRLVIEPKKH